MAKQYINLVGQSFGGWTVIKHIRFTNTKCKHIRYYLCKCTCGTIAEIPASNLTTGKTHGCRGCKNKPRVSDNVCSVSGCGRNCVTVKHCLKHYKQFKRWGAILTSAERIRQKGIDQKIIQKKIWDKRPQKHKERIINNNLQNPKIIADLVKRRTAILQGRKIKAFHTTSQYVGVSYKPQLALRCWVAQIGFKMKLFYLGIHATEEEAALAYNKKALELYGSNAKLNKVTFNRKA